MRILIFGATGMLGHTLFRYLSADSTLSVFGTVRSTQYEQHFPKAYVQKLIFGVNVENIHSIASAFIKAEPEIVINCVGLVKQLLKKQSLPKAIAVNAQFPHQLAALCKLSKSRLIHISTDCVFSGNKGNYSENDTPDTCELYGQTKLLGEVRDEDHALTLRTSIIGHELESKKGLLEWFLTQAPSARGFHRTIFSGLPTIELSKIIKNYLFSKQLTGLYHVGAAPINKHDLLCLIAKAYQKDIEIIKDESMIIDRSLNVTHFTQVSSYVAPSWPLLIESMHENQKHLCVKQ